MINFYTKNRFKIGDTIKYKKEIINDHDLENAEMFDILVDDALCDEGTYEYYNEDLPEGKGVIIHENRIMNNYTVDFNGVKYYNVDDWKLEKA